MEKGKATLKVNVPIGMDWLRARELPAVNGRCFRIQADDKLFEVLITQTADEPPYAGGLAEEPVPAADREVLMVVGKMFAGSLGGKHEPDPERGWAAFRKAVLETTLGGGVVSWSELPADGREAFAAGIREACEIEPGAFGETSADRASIEMNERIAYDEIRRMYQVGPVKMAPAEVVAAVRTMKARAAVAEGRDAPIYQGEDLYGGAVLRPIVIAVADAMPGEVFQCSLDRFLEAAISRGHFTEGFAGAEDVPMSRRGRFARGLEKLEGLKLQRSDKRQFRFGRRSDAAGRHYTLELVNGEGGEG